MRASDFITEVFHFVGKSPAAPSRSNYYLWHVQLSNGQHYKVRASSSSELKDFQNYFKRKWGKDMPDVEVVSAKVDRRLDEEELNELFDPKKIYPYEWSSDYPNVALFKTEDGSVVNVQFDSLGSESILINFDRNGKDTITGGGDQFKILNTVVQIVFQFVVKNKPRVIAFEAMAKSRMSLYTAMVHRLIKLIDRTYRIGDKTDLTPREYRQFFGLIGDNNSRVKTYIIARKDLKKVQPTDVEFTDVPLEEELRVDVPNEEWLQSKIDYAIQRGRNRNGVPYMGTSTAYARRVEVPVSILAKLPGMNREQENVRQDDLRKIMKIMKDTGKLPLTNNGTEYEPFINVAYNGEAWVNEGNHRIMAAAKLGWDSLPIEIRYFDGGERIEHGEMYPPKIGLA